MKLFNVFMISALALVMFACKSDPKKDLVGTWSVIDADFSEVIANMPAEQIEMFEQMDMNVEDLIKEAIEGMKKMKMSFSADGSVISTSDDKEMEDKGTWKLSDDTKTLTMTINGKDQDMDVVSLSAKSMVLNMKDQDQSIKLTLKKD